MAIMITCQMQHVRKNICTKPATWEIWYKTKPQEKGYLCDEHTAVAAKFDAENGNQLNGKRIP